MNNVVYFTLVLTVAAGAIFGAAYFRDKQRKATVQRSNLGFVSQSLLWLSRGVLLLTILVLIAAFALNEISFAKLAGILLVAYLACGFVFQAARRKGV